MSPQKINMMYGLVEVNWYNIPTSDIYNMPNVIQLQSMIW